MDRVVLAVPERRAAAEGWQQLLGAEHDDESVVTALGARSSRWRVGDGWVELLEPDGAGPLADAVAARGAHLFAGGFTAADVAAVAEHLGSRGVEPVRDGERLFLDAGHTGGQGLRLFIGPDRPRPPVGLLDRLYELTNLVGDEPAATGRYADLLGLDAARFEPIRSKPYGYHGTLTLFDRERLDRLEVITPDREGTTMHRFWSRAGDCLYMAFGESGATDEIEDRARETGAEHTPVPSHADRPDGAAPRTVFLHPGSMGGMMLGVSARSEAWRWSGHPERAASGT